MLCLIWRAYGGYIPWPVIHLDTGRKFKEIYEFRDRVALIWGFNPIIAKNEEALRFGISPDSTSRFQCCSMLKTDALKRTVKKHGFDALIMSIRHDEHYARGMEDLMSLRDENGNWQYWGRFGGFGLTAPEREGYNHIRIHPLLPWTEPDVWEYVMERNVPVNPLYFARRSDGGKSYRYRSLGCEPCTEAVESGASTVQEIADEVRGTPGIERSGRVQDKEEEAVMLRLRQLGYL